MGQVDSKPARDSRDDTNTLTNAQIQDNILRLFQNATTSNIDTVKIVDSQRGFNTSAVEVDTIAKQEGGGNQSRVSNMPSRQRFKNDNRSLLATLPKIGGSMGESNLLNSTDINFVRNLVYNNNETARVNKPTQEPEEPLTNHVVPVPAGTQITSMEQPAQAEPAEEPKPAEPKPAEPAEEKPEEPEQQGGNTIDRELDMVRSLIRQTTAQRGGVPEKAEVEIMSEHGVEEIRQNLIKHGVPLNNQNGGSLDNDLQLFRENLLNSNLPNATFSATSPLQQSENVFSATSPLQSEMKTMLGGGEDEKKKEKKEDSDDEDDDEDDEDEDDDEDDDDEDDDEDDADSEEGKGEDDDSDALRRHNRRNNKRDYLRGYKVTSNSTEQGLTSSSGPRNYKIKNQPYYSSSELKRTGSEYLNAMRRRDRSN